MKIKYLPMAFLALILGCKMPDAPQRSSYPISTVMVSQDYGEASPQKPLTLLVEASGTDIHGNDDIDELDLFIDRDGTSNDKEVSLYKDTKRNISIPQPLKTIVQFTGQDTMYIYSQVKSSNGEIAKSNVLEVMVSDIPSGNPNPPPNNDAPVILSSPVTQVNKGQPYFYQVVASDPNGDTLSYSLTQTPIQWLSMSSSGAVSGPGQDVNSDTPSQVEIDVSDGTNVTKQNYSLLIKNNDLIGYIQAPINSHVGDSLLFSGQIQNNINSQTVMDNSVQTGLEYILFREIAPGQMNLAKDKKIIDKKLNDDVVITLNPNGWFGLKQNADNTLNVTIQDADVKYNGIDVTNLILNSQSGINLANHKAFAFKSAGTYYMHMIINYNSNKTVVMDSSEITVQ